MTGGLWQRLAVSGKTKHRASGSRPDERPGGYAELLAFRGVLRSAGPTLKGENMPERQTPEALRAALKAGVERFNPLVTGWLADVERAGHDCLAAVEASPLQKRIAVRLLDDLESLPRYHEGAVRDFRVFSVGVLYERLRLAILEEPAEAALELGTRWRGHWLKATPLEQRILDATHDDNELCVHDLARRVWGIPYSAESRSRIDKTLSQLNRKLAPLGGALHIRGERLAVETDG